MSVMLKARKRSWTNSALRQSFVCGIKSSVAAFTELAISSPNTQCSRSYSARSPIKLTISVRHTLADEVQIPILTLDLPSHRLKLPLLPYRMCNQSSNQADPVDVDLEAQNADTWRVASTPF